MRSLNNITLLTINGLDNLDKAKDSLRSLIYCSKQIEFGSVKFLSVLDVPNFYNNYEYINIKPLDYPSYSNFVVKKLIDHVETDYVLLVQDDGFIINPDCWDDEFLDYDYIGAPWGTYYIYKGIRVGNGGFTLRSRKLLKVSKEKCPAYGINEDAAICIDFRGLFTMNGCVFAPLELAAKFSQEGKMEFEFGKTFGFHGRHHEDFMILKNEIIL